MLQVVTASSYTQKTELVNTLGVVSVVRVRASRAETISLRWIMVGQKANACRQVVQDESWSAYLVAYINLSIHRHRWPPRLGSNPTEAAAHAAAASLDCCNAHVGNPWRC